MNVNFSFSHVVKWCLSPNGEAIYLPCMVRVDSVFSHVDVFPRSIAARQRRHTGDHQVRPGGIH